MSPLPLEGIRVVDFAQVFAGPACTRILADLGADVIRFESPSRMDVTRNLIVTDNDGMDHHWHRASYFVIRNINKREMVVDLTVPQTGGAYFGLGSQEIRVTVPCEAGVAREVEVTMEVEERAQMRGLRVGAQPPGDL